MARKWLHQEQMRYQVVAKLINFMKNRLTLLYSSYIYINLIEHLVQTGNNLNACYICKKNNKCIYMHKKTQVRVQVHVPAFANCIKLAAASAVYT